MSKYQGRVVETDERTAEEKVPESGPTREDASYADLQARLKREFESAALADTQRPRRRGAA